ncbi:unnamed protein product [Caenorhabditis bovis]|nr:unnamed protein product [Caenorhabditis bovis]
MISRCFQVMRFAKGISSRYELEIAKQEFFGLDVIYMTFDELREYFYQLRRILFDMIMNSKLTFEKTELGERLTSMDMLTLNDLNYEYEKNYNKLDHLIKQFLFNYKDSTFGYASITRHKLLRILELFFDMTHDTEWFDGNVDLLYLVNNHGYAFNFNITLGFPYVYVDFLMAIDKNTDGALFYMARELARSVIMRLNPNWRTYRKLVANARKCVELYHRNDEKSKTSNASYREGLIDIVAYEMMRILRSRNNEQFDGMMFARNIIMSFCHGRLGDVEETKARRRTLISQYPDDFVNYTCIEPPEIANYKCNLFDDDHTPDGYLVNAKFDELFDNSFG